MHPSHHARTTPAKAALVMGGTGETVTYAELDARSNQLAHLFRREGLAPGDGIAFFLENHPRYFELLWAAQRSGLRYTCLSSKLLPDEVEYILRDCGAKALVTSDALMPLAVEVGRRVPEARGFVLGEAREGFESLLAACAALPRTPVADQSAGAPMLYSSGTTGRPKGVLRPLPADRDITARNPQVALGRKLYGWTAETVYLCPAPLYHAAPLAWSMAVHALGGTVVLMERFDAEAALALIQSRRVTSAQFVPTHFVRMLKLPEEVRSRHDLSSLRAVFHAAAPCPIPVKQQMMAWWGPIIHEYYAGTEANGFCAIGPDEWLARPGSVGRAMIGEVKICDDEGRPLPPRTEGLVYFANGPAFEYRGDPEKTRQTRNAQGWTTLGDVGWVDEEGYLYLTDRKSFMIISGGVNIYPQEIENLLAQHPKVADAAVVGAPHEEMGEQVVAVIQPMDWADAGDMLRHELMAYARANLSHVKTPRRLDFVRELPRDATGKLYKRLLRDRYAAAPNPALAVPTNAGVSQD
jgi:long-chain acyl-CoA synthetase